MLAERHVQTRVFPQNEAWLALCYKVLILGGILRRVPSIALAVALTCACVAPTLPLPPPAAPEITSAGAPAGMVRVSSVQGAEPNAIIFIYNTDPGLPDNDRVGGSQADAEGSWQALVYGKSGDTLEIEQQYQGTWSTPLDQTIP
jgi:hypothetical protein